MKYIKFSSVENPAAWDTSDHGVIVFANHEEAKKAEALFQVMQNEIDALRSARPEGRFSIGELKGIYTIARHVGIPGTKIDAFVKTAAMAGYIFVRATVDASEPQKERGCQRDGDNT